MVTYQTDMDYADKICNNDSESRKKFFLEMSDHAFWVAKKWHKRVDKDEDFYFTNTMKGQKISTDDETSDTYVWLLKKIVNATCKYKGLKNATLSTYIMGILNGPFTFNDWLKQKYGDTQYLPKIVLELPVKHQKTYTMLKRKSNINKIASELSMDLRETEYVIHELKSHLFKNGKGSLLTDKNINKVDSINNDDSENPMIENLENSNSLTSDQKFDFEIIYNELKDSLSSLKKSDMRLLKMYWSASMTVSQIMIFIKNENLVEDFKELKITSEKEFYNYINDLCKKFARNLNADKPEFYNDYDLNSSKIKHSLKVIFKNFKI